VTVISLPPYTGQRWPHVRQVADFCYWTAHWYLETVYTERGGSRAEMGGRGADVDFGPLGTGARFEFPA
jgi:hypothetical protein